MASIKFIHNHQLMLQLVLRDPMLQGSVHISYMILHGEQTYRPCHRLIMGCSGLGYTTICSSSNLYPSTWRHHWRKEKKRFYRSQSTTWWTLHFRLSFYWVRHLCNIHDVYTSSNATPVRRDEFWFVRNLTGMYLLLKSEHSWSREAEEEGSVIGSSWRHWNCIFSWASKKAK